MPTVYQAPRVSPAAAARAATEACHGTKIEVPRRPDVSVNGVVIDRDAIARETQNHPAARPIEAWLAAARALVVRELLLQEARRLRIDPAPESDAEGRRETDEEAMIRSLVEQQVKTPKASRDECVRYYEQNQQRFRSADLCEVRHILCAAPPADAEAREAAKARARAAIAILSAEPHRFAALAADLSACPSAKSGGNIGQITKGQTVPEFEAALERMQPGELCGAPIETRYGFHVVELQRRIGGNVVPFEIAHQRIAEWLDERVVRNALRQYVTILAGNASISGVALDAESSPLVQ